MKQFALLMTLAACLLPPSGHLRAAGVPEIGAQIWLEPDSKAEDIELWMGTLETHHLPLARIFFSAGHSVGAAWQTDFALYDKVFDSAKKHGIKILGTLGRGAFPFPPANDADVAKAASFIGEIVRRYKDHPALDTWIVWNEPGFHPAVNDRVVGEFQAWLARKYGAIKSLNQAWGTGFAAFDQIKDSSRWSGRGAMRPAPSLDWNEFGRYYQAQLIESLADIVRQIDPVHGTHTNPHALLGNLSGSGYDLPAWRPALSALGVSLHPAWHFGLLRSRDQYALGAAYMCDMVRGSFEPKPFWVTELQGGPNIYSGNQPLCPEPEDITQWLWTAIGSDARRVVFWCLNARPYGVESAEWAMLDLQNRPSERLIAASRVADAINAHPDFFAGAKTAGTPITLILSLETMALQLQYGEPNAHLIELMGLYETLQEMGIPVRIKHIDDFSWSAASGNKELVILPHVSALSAGQAEKITSFVKAGNTVLATGLSGFFDPHDRVWSMAGFPLREAFGGQYKEVRYLGDKGAVTLSQPAITLPSHLLTGDIDNQTGQVLGKEGDRVLAVRNRAGEGEVVWVPSLIGSGAWFGDHEPLAQLLKVVTDPFAKALPFKFSTLEPHLLLRVLENGHSYVTVVINGGTAPAECTLVSPPGLKPVVIAGGTSKPPVNGHLTLGRRETVVLLWQ